MINALKRSAKLYFVWLIMIVFISVGVTTTNLFSVAAMAVFLIFAFFAQTIDNCVLLFGLMPFANIFKYQAGATSFFTICELLVVFIAIFNCRKFKVGLFVPALLLFSAYILLTSANHFNALGIVKVILGFCLIYLSSQNAKKCDVVNIAYLLSMSTILMMFLSSNENFFVFIESYLVDQNFVLDEFGHASDLMRVGGFFGDPNYCSILIVISVALLCVLYYYKEIKSEFWLFLSFLIPLGFTTYSKSYFLCITILVLFLILFVLLPKHKGWALISVAIVAVVVSMAVNGKIEAINVIVNRFSNEDISSGRALLNDFYLSYLWQNPLVLFFGEGINADRAIGAWNNVHNLYIEALFKLGIVGSLLYLSVLLIGTKSKKANGTKRKFVNYFPLIVLLILYYALAGICMYELPFYLSIAFLAKDYNLLDEENKTQTGSKLYERKKI